MRCVRYGLPGLERPGLIDGSDRWRDAQSWVEDWAGEALAPEYLAALAVRDADALPEIAPQRLGPCVGGIGKIIGVALNYQLHVTETGSRPTTEPTLFLKATSALCGPDDPLPMPPGGSKLDWEVELGVVIGRRALDIPAAEASRFIAGYCLLNDVSERAFQLEHGGQQHSKGKSADGFCPLGPWLLTPEAVPDVQAVGLRTAVNGQIMQNGNTAQMIYPVMELVSYCSRFMTLLPGDIIATGTPDGVGRGLQPPRYLRIGDEIIIEGDGLGRQRRRVTAPSA